MKELLLNTLKLIPVFYFICRILLKKFPVLKDPKIIKFIWEMVAVVWIVNLIIAILRL